jgi:threonine synthase
VRPGPGIWRHAALFDDGGGPARLAAEQGWTLGEGDTPLEEWPSLARELGLQRLLLKREDRNPGGSHKDRGLLYQVAAHRSREGAGRFVLSSSGNAAVSAAAAVRVTGDALLAFIAPDTAPSKVARLLDGGALLVVSDKPINYARYASRVFGLTDLRGTKDPVSSIGYRSIAGELLDARPTAVVTFASSGTSLQGILDGFAVLGHPVAGLAVQAGVCLGIARALHPGLAEEPDNPAGRLGIRNPPDAGELAERLRASGGGAVAVTTEEVLAAARRLEERDDEAGGPTRVSPEGAAVLAAIVRMARVGTLTGVVVGVMTGHGDQWHDEAPAALPPAGPGTRLLQPDSYVDLRDQLVARGLEVV